MGKVAIRKHWDKLEEAYEDICELMMNSKSLRDLAEMYEVPKTTLYEFLSHPDRIARTRAIHDASADMDADMAMRVLMELPEEPTMPQVAKAKEIANQLRWRAMKKSPGRYGDKIQVDATIEVKRPMTGEQFAVFLQNLDTKLIKPAEGGGEYIDYDESGQQE